MRLPNPFAAAACAAIVAPGCAIAQDVAPHPAGPAPDALAPAASGPAASTDATVMRLVKLLVGNGIISQRQADTLLVQPQQDDKTPPPPTAPRRALMPVLERKVGRILFGGFGTGVEVGHAMVHGGPFPATSDARTTSVGSLAIDRFLRPVSYQDMPDELLPPALQEANPLGLHRLIDGAIA